MKVAYYSDSIKRGEYDISLDITFAADGTIEEVNDISGASIPADSVFVKDGNMVTITASQGFELKLEVTDGGTNPIDVTLNLVGFGAMDMQIGANEGQQLDIRIPKVDLKNIGIYSIDVSTPEGAEDALGKMGDAVKYISSVRSGLGAYQNRLEHTISSLDISSENMTAAYSRIMDADMAEEMTEYTTVQVLTQASTSMLAQANERPAQVLQLLQ